MRIGYIGDASSIHVQRWAKFFVERGHQVFVITDVEGEIEGGELYSIGECLPPVRVKALSVAYQILRKTREIDRLIERTGPDILHGHYATNYGFLAALSGFHPLVVTVHGSDLLIDYDRSILEKLYVTIALRNADLITSPADHMTRRLIKVGIGPQKILTVQYGIDTKVFYPGSSSNHLAVLSTRSFEPKYNVELLINAIPIVLSRFPDLKFALVAKGSMEQHLRRRVEELKITHATDFIGGVASEMMPEVFRSASVYVSTSTSDGLSISLCEAMACGLFPVATDIPGNRELIHNGENGFLVPTDDSVELAEKICYAIKNVEFRERAIKKNIEFIHREMSFDKNMQKVERAYQNLIDRVV